MFDTPKKLLLAETTLQIVSEFTETELRRRIKDVPDIFVDNLLVLARRAKEALTAEMKRYALEGDLLTLRANYLALVCFGREQNDGRTPSGYHIDGFPISWCTLALMFADIDWLMTLWDKNQ